MIGCHWAARTADEYEYEYEYRCAEYECEEQPIASKLGCSSYSVRFADGTRTRTRTRCSSQNSMMQGNSITILLRLPLALRFAFHWVHPSGGNN